MRRVRPQASPIDYSRLALTPEEGFVLSRVDSPTTTRELVALTGLDEQRIEAIVDKLAGLGAIDADVSASAPSSVSSPTEDGLRTAPSSSASADENASEADPPEAIAPSETEEDLLETSSDAEPGEDGDENTERNYRKIFEATYRHLPTDHRVELARRVQGPDLLALCLDPDPRVIHAILENPLAGLDHSRYIALWHRTPQGLDHVAKDVSILRDRMVERRILRNPQVSDPLLQKILNPKRLIEVYKTCIDRDILERTRQKARTVLQKRWSTSAPEERVELLLTTEARCLVVMVGCTIDGRSVQILCGRSSFTTMFITSIARFPAAPPPLLAHLAKQPLVRRNPQLRRLIQGHKNTPGEAKRSL